MHVDGTDTREVEVTFVPNPLGMTLQNSRLYLRLSGYPHSGIRPQQPTE